MRNGLSRYVVPVVGAVLVVAMLFIGGASGWLLVPNAQAQATQVAAGVGGTITVVGEGKVTLQPDIARVTIGVETLNTSVRDATTANKVLVESVLDALRAEGIGELDLRTTGYSVYADRYGPEGLLDDNQVRYRVSNSISVIIRDLDNVGTILDVAVDAGANNIYGVEFAVDDPGSYEADARGAAVENALDKATELAELTGVSLGKVIAVSEVIGEGGGYYAGSFSEMARMGLGGGGGAPISPGQLDLVMRLQLVYAIGE